MYRIWLIITLALLIAYLEALSIESLFIEPFRVLPDGEYLIERKILPPNLEREAVEDDALSDAAPDEVNSEYYKFLLRGGDFIVRQMVSTENGFIGKGNFFASISDEGSWYFEEHADRVILFDQRFTQDMDVRLNRGLLDTTFRFGEELKLLGLHELDWASVELTGAETIKGNTSSGQAVVGTIFKNDSGLIEEIEYEVSDGRQYRIGLSRDLNQDIISNTKVATRSSSNGEWWELEYNVINSSILPMDLHMYTFWNNVAEASDRVFEYDWEAHELVYVDELGNTRVVGNLPDSFPPVEDNSGVPLAFIIVLVIAAGLPVVLVIFSQSRRFGFGGKNKKQDKEVM